MGYSGYNGPTGPRPIRVIIGGGLSIACLLIGTIVMTHEYHRALMMQEKPAETDWQTLVDNGPVDNAFVRIFDVQLDATNPFEELDEMFGDFDPADFVPADFDPADFDPAKGDPAKALKAFVDSIDHVDAFEMIEMAIAPIKVVPRGTDPADVVKAIVIPHNESYLQEASRQLKESGTLSGLVSTYHGDEFVRAVTEYAGGAELLEELDQPQQTVYTLEPMAEALDRSSAASNFWFCGLGLAFGLILCGSGGPAISTCVFFFGPAVISLLGYPMRYGRGGNTVRAIYLLAGLGLMFYGYQFMIVQGGFGQIGGNPIFHSVGFIFTFVGIAAVLSVPSQILSRKIEASMDVGPAPKQEEERMSVAAACSLEPIETDSIYYRDRDLVVSVDEMPEDLKWASESLLAVGFGPAVPQAWIVDAETTSPAVLQLGCQNMVVSDIECNDERTECRLVSILHDGMTVITLSSNIRVGSNRRIGSNGLYVLSKSNEPDQMLAQHLEETIGIAERRDTSVVTIEESEINDVDHFARRVLADIRNQYGELTAEIDRAAYGRFSYPIQPVGEPAAVNA